MRIKVISLIGALLFLASPVLAASHYVTLTWTTPTNQVANSYINIYKGTATGAESTTPLNTTPISIISTTYQDNNVLANGKYYYIAKQCAIDNVSGSEVCSPPSNEASASVPLATSDQSAPGTLTATGH